jgi:hypothetical protein
MLTTLVCAAALLLGSAPVAHAELYAWGTNSEDALCDGHTSAEQAYSTKYVKSSELAPTSISGGEDFVVFAAGGKAYACGPGLFGTLGRESAASPTPLEVAIPEPVAQVAAGEHYALALTRSGAVYEWGCMFSCDRGLSYTGTVHRVEGIHANSITAGADWAAASLTSGNVVTWGSAQRYFCIPDHETEGGAPEEVYGASEVAQVAAGLGDLYMRTRAGEVLSCGPNDGGTLGDGSEAQERGVHHVSSLAGIREVAATRLAGYAVTQAGELYAWGSLINDYPVANRRAIWPVGYIATARENGQVLTSAAGTAHGQFAWGAEANLAGFSPPAESEGPASTLSATVGVVGPGYFDDYAGIGAAPAPKSLEVYEPASDPPPTRPVAPSLEAPQPGASVSQTTGSGPAGHGVRHLKKSTRHHRCRGHRRARRCARALRHHEHRKGRAHRLRKRRR